MNPYPVALPSGTKPGEAGVPVPEADLWVVLKMRGRTLRVSLEEAERELDESEEELLKRIEGL